MERPRLTLIEDDTRQLQALCAMLGDDYAVTAYGSSTDALRDLMQSDASDTPDLIVCDVTLGDTDGLTLRKTIQQHPSLHDCPFIFLTESRDALLKKRAIALGIDDYLQKPVTQADLLQTLSRILARNSQLHRVMDAQLNQCLNEPLRPALPDRIGDYRLHLAYREIESGGGDFVFHLTSGETDFILIGDVMGHGAPAKFFLHAYAGYLYGLVRSFRHYRLPPDAADLLRLLNREVTDDPFLQRWMLTCAALGFAENGTITMAHAGHPFLWRLGDDGAHPLVKPSVMPGLIGDVTFQNVTLDLNLGERLLVTTDGAHFQADTYARDESTADLLHRLAVSSPSRDDATALILERL